MYLDFFLLIFDYFKTINRKIVFFEWVFPLVIVVFLATIYFYDGLPTVSETFNNNVIRLLSVLVGFSITIIIILTTGQSKNLETIKNTLTDVIINKKKTSLFKLLIINFTYAVVIEIGIIFVCLLYPIILDKIDFNNTAKIIGFSFILQMVLHILLLNIRNLTDFCLVITADNKTSKNKPDE